MKMDKQKEALDRFYLALQKAELANDDLTKLKAYINISWALMELNQFEQAVKRLHTALALIKEKGLGEKYAVIAYNNLASSYGSLDKTDSAYFFAQKGVELSHRTWQYNS